MLQHDRQRAPGRAWLILVGTLLFGGAPAAPAHAEDRKTGSSLDLIPADAAYYKTMLRNREQIDAIAKSKAWGRIKELPAAQMLWQIVKAQYTGPDGKLADLRKWLEQAENRELVDLVGDAFSQEVFLYGGATWVGFVDLYTKANQAQQFAPLLELMKAPDRPPDPKAQIRGMLRVVANNPDKVRIPDFIVGFKLRDTKKAESQVLRLEMLLKMAAMREPMLMGRVKRVKVGGGDFLTLNLDGSLIPWEQSGITDLAEAAGEFDGVVKKLKHLTLTLSLGVRGDYLLLAIGASTDVLTQLGGKGRRLTDRPELKPVLAAADKRLTTIGYASKELLAKSQVSREDIDEMSKTARTLLPGANLPEDKRKAIEQDVADLAADLKKWMPRIGAELSFAYLTERGSESYTYRHGDFPQRDGSKPLTLLEHVGGDPILAVVGRSKGGLAQYQALSRWVKKAYGHAEPVILDKLNGDQKDKYEKISKAFLPLLRRLDEVTADMLLPALADGETGLVFDARWKSKQWLKAMPPTDRDMPMLEAAVVVGVSDADLLKKAMPKYRAILRDALGQVRELAPPGQVPEIKVPEPEVKELGSEAKGTLYLYRLPAAWGVDPQVVPTGGLSARVGVLALSPGHAERLLTRKPLKVEGGLLANAKRPLAGAAYFNWPAFVDALTPWALYGAEQAQLEKIIPGADKDEQKAREDIRQQVRTLLDALKVFRVVTSVTYAEEGVLVTHSELVIRDR